MSNRFWWLVFVAGYVLIAAAFSLVVVVLVHFKYGIARTDDVLTAQEVANAIAAAHRWLRAGIALGSVGIVLVALAAIGRHARRGESTRG